MTDPMILLDDPGWIIAVKGLLIFVLCVLLTLLSVWGERRIVARMQMRLGPNRVGPFGLIQALADGVKLALKEDIIPKAADRAVFILAPIISGFRDDVFFQSQLHAISKRLNQTKGSDAIGPKAHLHASNDATLAPH